jgi:DNA primase
MDAIQAHQAGFSNVVAQMGTALTETQLRLLVPRYASRIVLALDADAAGQSATRRSLETARQTLEADYAGRLSADIRILQIPGAKDPDDLLRESPDAWQALVDGALPVADYVIESETADLSAQATVQEREALARRILPILTASEKDLYTQDNVQKLARRLRIPERDLLAWAQEVKQAARNKPQRPAPQTPPASAMLPGEPPPLDYDSMLPPPEFDDAGGPVAVPAAGGSAGASGVQSFDGGRDTALEGYCLRMLCLQPDLYYQVNRRFRELAGEDAELAKGPLADLGEQDFLHSHHRELVKCLADAVKQTNRDVHDYMEHALDEDLLQYVGSLLINEEDGIRGRVGMQRFSSDLTRVILKEYERRVKPSIDPIAELVEKALVLRLRRLRRELDELVFVQRDAQETGDYTTAAEYGMRIMMYNRAQTRLDEAVKKQRTLLIT